MGNENDNLVKKNPPEISGGYIITPSIMLRFIKINTYVK
jgi:hypothetical protein